MHPDNNISQKIWRIIKWILTILNPPVAVFVDQGRGLDLDVNIMLTILGFVPGSVHAIWVVFHRRRPDEVPTSYPSRGLKMAYCSYTVAYLILMIILVLLGTILLANGSIDRNSAKAYCGFFLISFGFVSFISTASFGCIIWGHFRKFTRLRYLPRRSTVCPFVISNSNPVIGPVQQVTSEQRQPEPLQLPFDDLPPSYASVWGTPFQLDRLPSYDSYAVGR